MPCYDERSSPSYIVKEYSEKIGRLTEMLCEACGRLDHLNQIKSVSGNTQKWWASHKAEDEKRRKAAAEREALRKLGEKTLKKLTPEELEALQFVRKIR